MKKRFNKTLLLLVCILVLPVVAYGVFELNSLTVDERELETIYERQLESVLFSINQYTQGKVSEITSSLDKRTDFSNADQIKQELGTHWYFAALAAKGVSDDFDELYVSPNAKFGDDFQQKVDSLYQANDVLVRRLVRYKESEFQKLESNDAPFVYNGKEYDFFFFVVGTGSEMKFCIYIYDAISFIEQTLVPKFQEITQGDFVLTCSRISDGFLVYSTDDEIQGSIENEPLDLLPKYQVGIARVGGTVEDAVNKRKNQNLMALGLLMVVMIIGIALVFFNIQREMELAQKKADFVSNVSHEIRTPLALISMFAETLQLGRVKTEEKKQEYYDIITKEVARLTNMVNRILSFSKIEADKREYHKEPLNLNDLVQDVINTYSYHLNNNGFTHSLELADGLPEILADREAVVEMLVNLIDNGIKYSDGQKHITIQTGLKGSSVCLSVIDKGIGIPANELEKLFEKFYRVPKGDVHNTKGSGLGLTIVKHIMDAHQGSVHVESKVGEGSTFQLIFSPEQNHHG
ncbi:sensor histidine kinase [Roseivirga pacifica]|uniref:sensor histidine kinase n=1 Tax=Roseivirga pacifica TaxID=1267423 RepID=UPI003BA8648A